MRKTALNGQKPRVDWPLGGDLCLDHASEERGEIIQGENRLEEMEVA